MVIRTACKCRQLFADIKIDSLPRAFYAHVSISFRYCWWSIQCATSNQYINERDANNGSIFCHTGFTKSDPTSILLLQITQNLLKLRRLDVSSLASIPRIIDLYSAKLNPNYLACLLINTLYIMMVYTKCNCIPPNKKYFDWIFGKVLPT